MSEKMFFPTRSECFNTLKVQILANVLKLLHMHEGEPIATAWSWGLSSAAAWNICTIGGELLLAMPIDLLNWEWVIGFSSAMIAKDLVTLLHHQWHGQEKCDGICWTHTYLCWGSLLQSGSSGGLHATLLLSQAEEEYVVHDCDTLSLLNHKNGDAGSAQVHLRF
jgi:hypothetical protein